MGIVKDFDDLKHLVNEMQSFFSGFHGEIDEDEKHYHLEFSDELNLPESVQEQAVVLPTARANVDSAVDAVSPDARRVEVSSRSDTPNATALARKQQRFYESLLNWIEDDFDQSPYRQGVKRLASLGIEVWKFIPNPATGRPKKTARETEDEFSERLESWKVQHLTSMPFRLIPVHPQHVFFDPFNPSPRWAFQKEIMYAGDVTSIYPDWGNPMNRKMTDRVEVIEYWDNEMRAVMVDGESALAGGEVVKHKWGVHPYIVGASGYGIDDKNRDPSNRYVGMNRFLRDMLYSESRNYSVVDIVLKSQAWPIRIATGDRANDIPNIELKYGRVHPFPAGVKIEDLNPSLPPDMVFAHQQQAAARISDIAAPRAVRGLRESGTTSGIDQQTQLGQALLKYRPLASGIGRMMSKLCQKAGIYMQTTIKHEVAISAGARSDELFEVTSSTFKQLLPVHVRINVLDPDDEVRKKNAVAQELAAGTMDQLTGIEELHPDKDARKIQQRVTTDRLINHPMIQQVLAGAIAEEVMQSLELEELLQDAVNRISGADQVSGAPGQGTPSAETAGGIQPGSREDSAQRRIEEGRL